MKWIEVQFGKYKGKALPQIIFSDPDWFFWAIDKNVFANKGRLAREAEKANYRACNIKIPHKKGEELVAEYTIHPITGKFCKMEIVSRNQPLHEGAPTLRKDRIDLSFPRHFANYDKLGCKLLLADIKFYVFGNSEIRLTKARCEEFFNNDNNFIL